METEASLVLLSLIIRSSQVAIQEQKEREAKTQTKQGGIQTNKKDWSGGKGLV